MNILITNPVHEILIRGLESLDCVVDYKPEITLIQTRDIIAQYEGVIINTKIKADRQLLTAGNRLRFVGRLGSGLDIIDLKAAAELGIQVIRAANANANAVGEHVLGMLLMLMNKLNHADNAVRNMKWVRESYRGIELNDKCLGIVGFGHNGSLLARRLKGFDTVILAYDPYVEIKASNVQQVPTLEELCRSCDIISFHVPLTEETRHMANDAFFDSCKKQPIIVNTSRGKVVDSLGLLRSLNLGLVAGAALDVFENEHPGTYSATEIEMYGDLFSRLNVVLSPHVAGWTVESYYKISKEILDKVTDLFSMR